MSPRRPAASLFWERYVPDGERAAARDCVLAASAASRAREHEGRWVQRDGTPIDVAWSCTPLPRIASGPVYLISGTDITDRKRHEAEVRAVESAHRRRGGRRAPTARAEPARRRAAAAHRAARPAAWRPARPDRPDETRSAAVDELAAAVKELRGLAQGIHPSALSERGLRRPCGWWPRAHPSRSNSTSRMRRSSRRSPPLRTTSSPRRSRMSPSTRTRAARLSACARPATSSSSSSRTTGGAGRTRTPARASGARRPRCGARRDTVRRQPEGAGTRIRAELPLPRWLIGDCRRLR